MSTTTRPTGYEADLREERIKEIAGMAVCAPQAKDRFTADFAVAADVRESLADCLFELIPLIEERFAARTWLDQRDAEIQFFNEYEKLAAQFAREFVEAELVEEEDCE